ncbi:hypothetical protein H1R20_g11185, partial [Candolleomyces eurysporus]
MWDESEVLWGYKLDLSITSQILRSSVEAILSKIRPFAKRIILFVAMLRGKPSLCSTFGSSD